MSVAVKSEQPKTTAAARPGFLAYIPLDEFFSLDVRSLAVLRIGLGILLLTDWLVRLPDLSAHYSDAGIVPRSVIGPNGPFSLNMLSGSAWWAGLLAAVACVFAVLLVLGWRTQFTTFISWLLLLSIHSRNYAVMQGGDVVLRMLLFWGLFLPLGACYSLDALRERRAGPWRPRVLSPASVALILQVCMIYLFAAAWKTDDAWRTDHTAVYLALSLDGFATRLGHFLLNFPQFLKLLTAGTLVLEAFGPALLFMPFANARMRVAAVVAFCVFHAGLGLCLELGNFPWVCGLAWLSLLPTWFWDRLEERLRSARRAGLTIYYDGGNALHRKYAEAARTFLLLYEARVVSACENEKCRTWKPVTGPWLVLDAQGRTHQGVEAFLCLVRLSPLYWPLAYLLNLGPLRGAGAAACRWLAARRPRRPAAEAEAPAAAGGGGGLLQNTLVIFLIVYLVLWNLRTLPHEYYKTYFPVEDHFPSQVNGLGYALGLEQSWGLFAPSPGRWDGWYVIPARLENGRVVDLFNDGAPVSFEKPELVSATYSNSRWRKMMMNLVAPDFAHLRWRYANWLLEDWNSRHGPGEKIRYLDVIYMFKYTEPDREVSQVSEKRLGHWPPYAEDAIGGAVGLMAKPALYDVANRPLAPDLKGGPP